MGFYRKNTTISYSAQTGDLEFSKINRFINSIKNFYLENEFVVVAEDKVSNEELNADRFILRFRNTPLIIYLSAPNGAMLSVAGGFGYTAGVPVYTWTVDYAPFGTSFYLNTAGSITLQSWVGGHFGSIYSEGTRFFFGMQTELGWVIGANSGRLCYVEEGLYYFALQSPGFRQVLSNTDLQNKHFLLQPMFSRALLPQSASNYRIHDQLIYSGEAYESPASMGSLSAFSTYQDELGTQYCLLDLDSILFVD